MIWIDKARISAALAIVVLHTAILVQSANLIGSGNWWTGNIYNSLVRWAIPVFVMISGALLLDPDNIESLELFYIKRFTRIIIPLFAWSAIYLCLDYIYAAAYGIQISKQQIFLNLLEGKPHFHLWFIYMIIGLYIFTPFFRLIIKNTSHRELQILVLIMFLIAAFSFIYTEFIPGIPPLFITKFIPYIPYYFLGYLIRSTQYKPSKFTLLAIFFCSGVITAIGFYFSA
ncbi:MAG: acyltransferase family protein, partial [Candidatus Stygibacter frigidus]|nr:acyltransferase family protein [Candidatus Stygibacter frigidus]